MPKLTCELPAPSQLTSEIARRIGARDEEVVLLVAVLWPDVGPAQDGGHLLPVLQAALHRLQRLHYLSLHRRRVVRLQSARHSGREWVRGKRASCSTAEELRSQ